MNFEFREADWYEDTEFIQQIRHSVFVTEQRISPELEWDSLDTKSDTQHFLGFINEQPVATARITNDGKICRLAVLKSERGKGIGTHFLQRILRWSLERSFYSSITLNAQRHAQTFYEKFGFKPSGSIFIEDGKECVKMLLDVESQETLEAIYQDDVIRLALPQDFSQHMAQMVTAARRRIDILTLDLNPEIYNTHLAQALSQFARSNRMSEVRILVQDTQGMRTRRHPIVSLMRRLPSSIAIRKLIEPPQKADEGFVIADARHLVLFNDESACQGFVNYRARPEAENRREIFDNLWDRLSITDPNLNQLSI